MKISQGLRARSEPSGDLGKQHSRWKEEQGRVYQTERKPRILKPTLEGREEGKRGSE